MNYIVKEQHNGERIDKFLVGVMENVSRTDVQKLIAAGEVKVGGVAAAKNFRVERYGRGGGEGPREAGEYA